MHLTGSIPNAQRGVGLIEVLIAVLVLSFGMLGMVGLQTWSLRNNQSALERGMATVQTHSIVDAMRADWLNSTTGAYNIGIDDDDPEIDEDNLAAESFRDVSIAQWRASLREALNPTATGSIGCNNRRCDIVVRWNDSRAQGDEDQSEFEITTEVEL